MNIALFVGTRPEVIKLAPLYRALKTREDAGVEAEIIAVSQQAHLLTNHLDEEEVDSYQTISISRTRGDLFELSSLLFESLATFPFNAYDLIVVQGDTTTAAVVAQAAFLSKRPVVHVEAGLRTNDPYRPFPEEMNRRLISQLATYHFAPTADSVTNLLAEGIPSHRIYEVGNTGIDAFHAAIARFIPAAASLHLEWAEGTKLVFVTCHRRENWDLTLEVLVEGLRALPQGFSAVWPCHPNPTVHKIVAKASDRENVRIVGPLPHRAVAQLVHYCDIVVTDSGGIIEEATEAEKPCLIIREETERHEALDDGCRLVTAQELTAFEVLLREAVSWKRTSKGRFGDGRSAERIAQILINLKR